MRASSANHVRNVRESLRRHILVVSVGKMARFYARQVKIGLCYSIRTIAINDRVNRRIYRSNTVVIMLVYLLDRNQSNFHVLYYFYDGMDAVNKLKQYHLPPGRRMRYLRISEKGTERKRSFKVRNDPRGNVTKFEELKDDLKILEMEEHCEMIWKVLAAILILGEIRFIEDNNGEADMDNNDAANKGKEI